MASPGFATTGRHVARSAPVDSEFTPNDIVPWLVGHSIEEIERELTIHTLAHHGGNRTLAAAILGVSVRTLRNKINCYGALGLSVPAPARQQARRDSAPKASLDQRS